MTRPAKLSEDVAVLEARLEHAEKELEAERRHSALFNQGSGPSDAVVHFIGGPLHLTSRALSSDERSRTAYDVAVHMPPRNAEYIEVSTGSYRLVRWAVRDSYQHYVVGFWEGLSTGEMP